MNTFMSLAKRNLYFLLHAFLLATVFAFSVLFDLGQDLYGIDLEEIRTHFHQNIDCEIVNEELICSENRYEYNMLLIDLEATEAVPGNYLMTKDSIIFGTTNYTYTELIELIGLEEDPITIDTVIELYEGFRQPMMILVWVIVTIAVWVGHLMFNFVRTMVNEVLTNKLFNKSYNYFTMYRITMLAVTPVVIINMIFRLFTSRGFSGTLFGWVPGISWLLIFIVDSAIILGMTYLMTKDQKEEKDAL